MAWVIAGKGKDCGASPEMPSASKSSKRPGYRIYTDFSIQITEGFMFSSGLVRVFFDTASVIVEHGSNKTRSRLEQTTCLYWRYMQKMVVSIDMGK